MRAHLLFVVVSISLMAIGKNSEAQQQNAINVKDPSPPREPQNPLWTIPLEQLSATRDRPIFSISRRPKPQIVNPTPINPPPKPVTIERPQLTLLGTAVGETEKVAIFLNRASNKVTRIREGDVISGWTLRMVETRAVIFEKGSETLAFELTPQGSTTGIPPQPMAPIMAPGGEGRP